MWLLAAAAIAWAVVAAGVTRLEAGDWRPTLDRQDGIAIGATATFGVVSMVLRRGGMTSDEYTSLPLPDQSTLEFYVADSGLPSLLHNLLFLGIRPWGNLDVLFGIHCVLYVLWVGVTYAFVRALCVDRSIAVLLTVVAVLDKEAIFRFQEYRSYATFSLGAAVGLLGVLRESPRMAFLGFALATLDNPLCAAALLGFAAVARGRVLVWTSVLGLAMGLFVFQAVATDRPGMNTTPHVGVYPAAIGALLLLRQARLRPLGAAIAMAVAAMLGGLVLGLVPGGNKVFVFLLPAGCAPLAWAIRERFGPTRSLQVVAGLLALATAALTVRATVLSRTERAAVFAVHGTLGDQDRPVYLGEDWKMYEIAILLTPGNAVHGLDQRPMDPPSPYVLSTPVCDGPEPVFVLRVEDDSCLACPSVPAPWPLTLRECP